MTAGFRVNSHGSHDFGCISPRYMWWKKAAMASFLAEVDNIYSGSTARAAVGVGGWDSAGGAGCRLGNSHRCTAEGTEQDTNIGHFSPSGIVVKGRILGSCNKVTGSAGCSARRWLCLGHNWHVGHFGHSWMPGKATSHIAGEPQGQGDVQRETKTRHGSKRPPCSLCEAQAGKSWA